MRLGVSLPHTGKSATKDAVVRGARHAEELGYDTVWALDRLLYPVAPRDPYPGTPDRKLWPSYFTQNLDPVETLTFAAAHTDTVNLGTAVLDIPFYNPVLLARRLTTLDHFSDGRLVTGFGLGYSEDEYQATGTTASVRGRRADEFLAVLKKAWEDDVVEHDGEFFGVPPSTIGPKPVQRPHPPIYLASYVPAGLRRIAAYADGWLPNMLPPAEVAEGMDRLKEHASEAGRDPSSLRIIGVYDETISPTDVDALRDLGVHELVIELTLKRSPDELLGDMERLRGVVE